MSLYSEKVLDFVSRIGDPITTKSTTNVTGPTEGLDLSSLLMMLMMSGAFSKKPTSTLTALPSNTGSNFSALASQAPSSLLSGASQGGEMDIASLLKMLGSLNV